MTTTLKSNPAGRDRQRWMRAVRELVEQIEAWAKDRRWQTQREEKEVRESRLGTYSVPVLTVLAPSGVVQVEPVARYVAKAEGRVDIYSFPALNRMMLVRVGGRWVLKTDAGVEWPHPWGRDEFAELVRLLNATP